MTDTRPPSPQEGLIVKDLKRPWLAVARRLQAAAHNPSNQGFMMISITMLVGPDGTPKLWTEPRCTLIEPRAAAADILAILGLDPNRPIL